MGGGSGAPPPNLGTLGLLREQARRRCPYCAQGVALAFSIRQAPFWLHVVHDPKGATWIEGGCRSAALWDRALAFLRSRAADCGRCCDGVVAQDDRGDWNHLDSDGQFTELCGRRDALAEITRREAAV